MIRALIADALLYRRMIRDWTKSPHGSEWTKGGHTILYVEGEYQLLKAGKSFPTHHASMLNAMLWADRP